MSTSGLSGVAEFGILMVCTGNTCRSPMAEQMLLSALRRELVSAFDANRAERLLAQVAVTSAGTAAHEGAPMTPESIAESERFGAGGRSHLAHRIATDDVRSANLILGMTADHRKAVAQLDPASARRSFTLIEFARLLRSPVVLDGLTAPAEHDFAGALFSVVAAAASSRGYLPPPSHASELDILDPYGRGARVYSQVGSVIGEAVTGIATSFVSVMRDT